jgi:iron uptake system component EfeO
MNRRIGVAMAVLAVTALAGTAPAAAANRKPDKTVVIEIREHRCHEARSLKPGATTFRVKNYVKGSAVSYQVLSGAQVLGQADSVAPGSTATFSLTLEPGDYATVCSNGSTQTNGTVWVKPHARTPTRHRPSEL